jgi:hypothetical protein
MFNKYLIVNELPRMPSGITHIPFFVRLGIILILVLGVYSGVSGRVRMGYLFTTFSFPVV